MKRTILILTFLALTASPGYALELTVAKGIAYTKSNLVQLSVSRTVKKQLKQAFSIGTFNNHHYIDSGLFVDYSGFQIGCNIALFTSVPGDVMNGNVQFKPNLSYQWPTPVGKLKVTYIHFSNGSTSYPNNGRDFLGLSLDRKF